MRNKQEEIDEKLTLIDSQISYMEQVIKEKDYPTGHKEAAKKTLINLEKKRNELLSRL